MRLFYAAMSAVVIFLAGSFSHAGNTRIMSMSSRYSLFSPSANAARSPASTSADIQAELDRFLDKRKPSAKRDWEVTAGGKIEFDKKIWTLSKDEEGSEVYLAKRPLGATEQKRTVIRNDDQSIRTISEYSLNKDRKENYWFVFFLDQKLAAATTCTDDTKDGLRTCSTAIPSVCKSLPTSKAAGWTLPKAIVPDVDLVEKRALATVITMRGESHQVENMAKTGNLIGLKHKMQTTRGRLTTTPVKSEYIAETSALCARL
jgi:hypothetical protein